MLYTLKSFGRQLVARAIGVKAAREDFSVVTATLNLNPNVLEHNRGD